MVWIDYYITYDQILKLSRIVNGYFFFQQPNNDSQSYLDYNFVNIAVVFLVMTYLSLTEKTLIVRT